MVSPKLITWCLCLLIVTQIFADDIVTYGMSRARVITILGAPKGSMSSPKAESLMYERGVITLTSGKVSNVSLISTNELARRKQAQQALTVSQSEQSPPSDSGTMKVHNDLTMRGEKNTFAKPVNIIEKDPSTGAMKVHKDLDAFGKMLPFAKPIWLIETDKSTGTMKAYNDLTIRGEKNSFAKPVYIIEKDQSTGAMKVYNDLDAFGKKLLFAKPIWLIDT